MTTKGKRAGAARPGVRVIDATQRLSGAPAPLQAPTKGRLYYDHEIVDAFFGGLPGIKNKVRWVREHLPAASRKKIGRNSAWYEAEIREYIDALADMSGDAGDHRAAS